ncbi:hypothetical protein Goklo_009986, partial [Gossypium klotzschianum]|nr:hypothetical protein [Gossypium klotzschianum]
LLGLACERCKLEKPIRDYCVVHLEETLDGNWACLNTNRSNKFEGGSATARGIAKNREVITSTLDGNWACLNTNRSNKFEGGSATTRGIAKNCEDGLTHLQDRGFGSILVETDNLEAAKAI